MVIIDSTSLLFSTIHYCSKDEDRTDDFSYYKEKYKDFFMSIIIDTKVGSYIAFGDEKPSFRHLLYPEFKKDRVYNPIKFLVDLDHYASTSFHIMKFKGLESDDLCCIAANLFKDSIIAHLDSDLDQIPGRHYDYGYRGKNKETPFYTIDNNQAKYNLFYTILKGGHNNTKGLKGAGEIATKEYLKENKGVLNAYINGFSYTKDDKTRNIKGLGELIGFNELVKNYNMCKLCTTIDEANYMLNMVGLENITEDFFNPIKIELDEW